MGGGIRREIFLLFEIERREVVEYAAAITSPPGTRRRGPTRSKFPKFLGRPKKVF